MRRDRLESEVQRQILAALGSEPDLCVFKNAVGVATNYDAEGRARKHPFGLGVGSPDLVGMLHFGQCIGTWFCLEVKCPGEDAEPHQAVCHDQWRAFGALVYVVHSETEARAALQDARAQVLASMASWAAEQ